MNKNWNPFCRFGAGPAILTGWGMSVLILLVIIPLLPGAPGLVIDCTFVLCTALCGGIAALMYRLPEDSFWRGLRRDLPTGLVLTIGHFGLILLILSTNNLLDLPARGNIGAAAVWMLVGSCLPGFLLARSVIRAWVWWRKLCQKHFFWELTFSILMLVAGIFALSLFTIVVYTFSFQSGSSTLTAPYSFQQIILWSVSFLVLILFCSAVGVILVLPLAAGFSFLVAKRLTRRINELTSAAAQMDAGSLSIRLPVDGQDEVSTLQQSFNSMAERLERNTSALEMEKEKVSALLKSQQDLVVGISHELRTPVSSILGYLESLQANWQNKSADVVQHDLNVMLHEGNRMKTILNDLLALSQSEMDRLSLQMAPVDASVIVRQAVDTMAALAWESGKVQVLVDQTDSSAPIIHVDASRLEQIVVNLIRNGIRHTPPGGVVSAGVWQEGDWAVLEVADTGEGIAASDLEHIWERFYRAGETSTAAGQDGIGIGLTLVKELTEAMDGRVSVSSEPGKGSVFQIRFLIYKDN